MAANTQRPEHGPELRPAKNCSDIEKAEPEGAHGAQSKRLSFKPPSFWTLAKREWPILCLLLFSVVGLSAAFSSEATWDTPFPWKEPTSMWERVSFWVLESGWERVEDLSGNADFPVILSYVTRI
jgi:hypothetical protein